MEQKEICVCWWISKDDIKFGMVRVHRITMEMKRSRGEEGRERGRSGGFAECQRQEV